MALKFLNKKGWHTGSLRNLETVWKAEQKHEAEQRKLEELRKQIEEERERSEFRQLQEQAGLVPRQERLEFLYDSGLAVGKGSNEGFRSAEVLPGTETGSRTSNNKQSSAPGALFEEKPQSANDTWRKLHSDPLLLIRQREQDALAQIKNNPVKMAMIRKSVEEKKKSTEEERKRKKHKHKEKKHTKYSSEGDSDSERSVGEKKDKRKRYRDESGHRYEKKHKKHSGEPQLDAEGDESEQEKTRKRNTHHREGEYYDRSKRLKHISGERSRSDPREEEEGRKSSHNRESDTSRMSRHKSSTESDPYTERSSSKRKEDKARKRHEDGSHGGHPADLQSTKNVDTLNPIHSTHHKRPPRAPKLSAEEKAARAREMQLDAEVHEEERWKRLKKASEADAWEAARNAVSGGRNFLDAAQKSIYGTEKGGSSSVEESVRRRAYYLQGRSSHDGNAFRR